ncbi:MAG TPA: AMP-binding protein, partial [Xanthobacteraceae bacterium]|nr:AMP-binding protein [Xanthobacteraceae bacterium]
MTDMLATTIQHARAQSIGDMVRRSAQRLGAKTALTCGETVWTYAEMNTICDRLGRGLGKFGVGKGDRVAVLSRNSHSFAALRF